MTDSSKRVFISYRRSVAKHLALLLFQELTKLEYEVFRDYDSIGAGDFERVILDQIAARDHFILLLVPETLDRCNYDEQAEYPKAPNPDDWLRREVEHALATGRNIVPLIVDDYKWHMIEPKLTGDLEQLKKINTAHLVTSHHRLFEASLKIICDEFLRKSATIPAIELSPEAKDIEQDIIQTSKQEKLLGDFFDAERLYSQAKIAYENKNYEEALNKSLQAVELNPKWAAAHRGCGAANFGLKNYKDAAKNYTQALKLDPYDALAFNGRGVTNLKLEDFKEAIGDFEKAILLDPHLTVAYVNRGRFYGEIGFYDQAISDLKTAIKLNPLDAINICELADVYLYMEQYGKAIDLYSKAINIDSTFHYAINSRGIAHLRRGHYNKAIADFEKALEIYPEYEQAQSNLEYAKNIRDTDT